MKPKTAEEMIDNSVVDTFPDGSRRVRFGEFPLGRKVQSKGPRCSGEHDFYLDRYPGIRHRYVDRVCRNCTRRVPVR